MGMRDDGKEEASHGSPVRVLSESYIDEQDPVVQLCPKQYFGSHFAIVSIISLGALFRESYTLALGQDSGIYGSLDFSLLLSRTFNH